MKTVWKGDALVHQLAGAHQINPDKTYKWSCFAYPFSHADKQYIFNTLTRKCVLLDDTDMLDTEKEFRTGGSEAAQNPLLAELAKTFFLVPEDKDEDAFYLTILRFLRKMSFKKGYTGYTILPTTACNARCIYCYEEGIQFETMDTPTAEQTVKFIIQSHRKGKKIAINWFGGEPLVGVSAIDTICAGLREAGIEYEAKMISNGSLINDEIIDKMKNEWNIRGMQISLDGEEKDYNYRKNYRYQYDSAYWVVLHNIKRLADNGIFVSLRCNVDEKNIDGVRLMIDDLKNLIDSKKYVSLYLSPLFEVQARESGIGVWEKSFEISRYAENAGFRVPSSCNLGRVNSHFCMADNPKNNIVISPDGGLYNCENFRSFDTIGSVYEGITNTALIEEFDNPESVSEKCHNCLLLPECTSFTRCEHITVSCKYSRKERLNKALHKKLDSGVEEKEAEVSNC